MGLVEVASLMVGAGAAGRDVLSAIVGAGVAVPGLLATGDGGFGGAGGAGGAVAWGGSGGFGASLDVVGAGLGPSATVAAGGLGAPGAVAAGGLGASGFFNSGDFAASEAEAVGDGLESGGIAGVGGPVRAGGIGVGGWLSDALGGGKLGRTDGPFAVDDPGAGIPEPGVGGLTGWTAVVAVGLDGGASAAFNVTRTVSRLSGTFEVLESG